MFNLYNFQMKEVQRARGQILQKTDLRCNIRTQGQAQEVVVVRIRVMERQELQMQWSMEEVI